MVKFLENSRYTVVGANNGKEAIELLNKQNFGIVITDILMPETDGFELVEQIRAMPAPTNKTPVIAISGGGRTIDANAALSALEETADVILKKPFSKKDLLDEVAKHIREGDVEFVG
jgi:CheY-like chemotaxis protein